MIAASTAVAAPHSPNSLVIVACRVDDVTGQPGRFDPSHAAPGWRDYELHIEKGELECQRDTLDSLVDATEFAPKAPRDMIPLHPDFAKPEQCGMVGIVLSEKWNEEHKGWAVVAVGCPTMIGIDADGDGQPDVGSDGHYVIKGWKLPECPDFVPGSQADGKPGIPMRCRFDKSNI